ncbi:MAG: Lar family restriction alleviation protein [Hafnia alvei]
MSNSELMPCPFCGSTPQLMEPNEPMFFGGYVVACQQPSCQAQGRFSGQKDKAIAAWNRRVSQHAASQAPDERNMFESWALSQIYTTTEVLAGLRTTSGYWDETATGAEANRLWKLWSSIRAAAPSPTSESKGVERG